MTNIIKKALGPCACIVLIAGIALAAQLMSVQVRSGQLRNQPGFLSKVVGNLPYGDRVDLKSEKGDWRHVSSVKLGKSGWIHVSALSEQEIVLNPTNKDVKAAAKSDELALAGKGFNKQVEQQYRKQNKLNYSKVDEMEQLTVAQTTITKFIKTGGLGTGGAR